MLLVSATAGLGGGNFASSMANISFFYPNRMKGWALGLNAAGGNIGVSGVQLLTPLLMGVGLLNLYQGTPGPGGLLQNAGLMWLPPLVIAIAGAALFMNNLTSARSTFKDQLAIVASKHTWIMSYIYIGTFGSFIGYSAAFPLLMKTQFPQITVAIAFLGPLVGSLSAPARRVACRQGGRRDRDVLELHPDGRRNDRRVVLRRHQGLRRLPGDVPDPLRYHRYRQRLDLPDDPIDLPGAEPSEGERVRRRSRKLAVAAATIESGAALGFIGAVGACGGYLIPSGFGKSIAATGSPHLALTIYLGFYATCLALTWWFYLRRSYAPSASNLAAARV